MADIVLAIRRAALTIISVAAPIILPSNRITADGDNRITADGDQRITL